MKSEEAEAKATRIAIAARRAFDADDSARELLSQLEEDFLVRAPLGDLRDVGTPLCPEKLRVRVGMKMAYDIILTWVEMGKKLSGDR